MPSARYQQSAVSRVELPDREWPSRRITRAPLWCAVDLRDGNQALRTPMDLRRKQAMFDLLVGIGFKEIEVGYPSASQADFDFVRSLVTGDRVPDDVTISVFTPARADLIERTVDSVRGATRAMIHLCNATAPLWREEVYGLDRDGVKRMATDAAKLVRDLAGTLRGTVVRYEYSPEVFNDTELDFVLDVCGGVLEIWGSSTGLPVVLNLPATVENATPNVYADQVEWVHRNLDHREAVILSLHPHNDRGTAVAATELALMAGADRVEGTLFGNGERTGNVCLVTLAMNLFSGGVDPQLDLSDLDRVRWIVEETNQLPVHCRHPYVGDLVYTAFSGTHQDAIKKGMLSLERRADELGAEPDSLPWAVPYLPIDPKDVGRSYQSVIRVNSQSGKSGVAYVIRSEHGLDLPRPVQVELSRLVQALADEQEREIGSAELWELFSDKFCVKSGSVQLGELARGDGRIEVTILVNGESARLVADENDLVPALVKLVDAATEFKLELLELITQSGAVYALLDVRGTVYWGVGINDSVVVATVEAIIAAVNRSPVVRPIA